MWCYKRDEKTGCGIWVSYFETRTEYSADTIRDLLAEMMSHAKAYDEIVFSNPGVYKYTVPWFDHVGEDTREWLGNKGVPMTPDFREYLEDVQFDNLRNQAFFEFLNT